MSPGTRGARRGADLTSPEEEEGELWIGSRGVVYLLTGREEGGHRGDVGLSVIPHTPGDLFIFEEKEEESCGARSISSWPKRPHSTST